MRQGCEHVLSLLNEGDMDPNCDISPKFGIKVKIFVPISIIVSNDDSELYLNSLHFFRKRCFQRQNIQNKDLRDTNLLCIAVNL